ncbi:helix-turn-helix domain-containing protein [Caviibacter abscessus]|uniref:helix-turn-helix domain-containing protein n=1 Tax=Caviibacter abscessus TaxID=1766719 RepID=UPI000830EF99|nr:helix-turn-helix transcriptional regulator [Caviibacter abscessus]
MKTTGQILVKYIPKKTPRQDLANILGVVPQYLSNILNDKKSPSKKFLSKIYECLSVSNEDKKAIENYEIFRKTPKQFQSELLELRSLVKSNFNKYETVPINYMGIFKDSGFLQSKNDIEMIISNTGYIFEFIEEGTFFVRIDSDNYEPFKNRELVFFEPYSEFIGEINDKYCMVEYKNKKEIYIVNKIDKHLILKAVNKNAKSYVLTKNDNKNVKILGILFGTFNKFKGLDTK